MPKHAAGPVVRKRKKSRSKRKSVRQKPTQRMVTIVLTRAQWRTISADVQSAMVWTQDNDITPHRSTHIQHLGDFRKALADEINTLHADKGDDDSIPFEWGMDDFAHVCNLSLRGQCKGNWTELIAQLSRVRYTEDW